MRNPDFEMYDTREAFTYDSKLNCYFYKGKKHIVFEDVIAEIYIDQVRNNCGTTYCSGKDFIDFTVDDALATLFSINGKEWQPYESISQIPKHLHFGVFIETLVSVIANFQER